MKTSSAVRKLHVLVALLDRVADEQLRAQFDISYSRSLFLYVLARTGPLTQHQLAVELHQSDPAVSTMLALLRKDDLVAVDNDPHHGRRRIVSLTKKGKTLAQKAGKLFDGSFEELLKSARVDERELVRSLDKLIDELSNESEKSHNRSGTLH